MTAAVRSTRCFVVLTIVASLAVFTGCSVNETYVTEPAAIDAPITVEVASAQNADPYEAGVLAARELRDKMGDSQPHTVVLTECFEDESRKQRLLKGVCSVLPKQKVFGFSTYGSFTQEGCFDLDSVSLMGIGGNGVATAAALQRQMGIEGLTMEENEDELRRRLRAAGSLVTAKLSRTTRDRLLILMADAHSPKNQFLVEGAQDVVGGKFPITGGSANKNAGQTFVYFQGKMYQDSVVALLLSGDFSVAMSGREAKDNAAVISTAREGAEEALAGSAGEPFAILAFNCAGRKGKLDNIADELTAIQNAIGDKTPLYGAYCAGEIGPADVAETDPEVLSSGVGWHVMFTVLGR